MIKKLVTTSFLMKKNQSISPNRENERWFEANNTGVFDIGLQLT
jgi:hypothetical protein